MKEMRRNSRSGRARLGGRIAGINPGSRRPLRRLGGLVNGALLTGLLFGLLCGLLSVAEADPKPELGAALRDLRRGDEAARDRAEVRLKAGGLEAAEALAPLRAGDQDYQQRRSRLLHPWRPALIQREARAAGTTKALEGRLIGKGRLLGKVIVSAAMDVWPLDGPGPVKLRLRTRASGGIRSFSGSLEALSSYDEHLRLLSSTIRLDGKDSAADQAKNELHIDQTWTRLRVRDDGLAVYRVQDRIGGRTVTVTRPAEAAMADLYLYLGRLMRFDSRKRQSFELSVLDPTAPLKDPGAEARPTTVRLGLRSIRRETTVVRGGGRREALRLEADIPGLPKAVTEPKVWLDAAQIPLKGRLGGLSVQVTAKQIEAPECPDDPALTVDSKDKTPAAKPGKKRVF